MGCAKYAAQDSQKKRFCDGMTYLHKEVVKTPKSKKDNTKTHYNSCELCDQTFKSISKLESIQMVNDHKVNEHPIDTEKYLSLEHLLIYKSICVL